MEYFLRHPIMDHLDENHVLISYWIDAKDLIHKILNYIFNYYNMPFMKLFVFLQNFSNPENLNELELMSATYTLKI